MGSVREMAEDHLPDSPPDLGTDVPEQQEEGNQNPKLWRIANLDPDAMPDSYRLNSPKEELILEYVEDFKHKFIELFPERHELLLCPYNECGIRKFVCTTIRPTHLGHEQLYDLESIVDVVSNYITFEPLQYTEVLPRHVASPTSTLLWQAGDSFGMATVLCSILLGVGYRAYVVSGYADKPVTFNDQTKVEPPELPFPPISGASDEEDSRKPSKRQTEAQRRQAYKMPARPKLASDFDRQQEEKAEADRKEQERLAELAKLKPVEEIPDDKFGKRVHCWVLVLTGPRDVDKHDIFIEPSTGRMYNPREDNHPYLFIESIWDHRNYYVNMQLDPKTNQLLPVQKMSFALTEQKWEMVFDSDERADGIGSGGIATDTEPIEDSRAGAGSGADGPGERLLDLPPSWVGKLQTSRETLAYKCPEQEKMISYSKAEHEIYADYMRPDGMVSCMRKFADENCDPDSEVEVVELFSHRLDKLQVRIMRPGRSVFDEETGEEIDYIPSTSMTKFDTGRSDGLKSFFEEEGARREFEFYPEARGSFFDNMKRRVETFQEPNDHDFELGIERQGLKTQEWYVGRDDRLNYRSITYTEERITTWPAQYQTGVLPPEKTGGGPADNAKQAEWRTSNKQGRLCIRKMAEKFDRNPDVNAHDDVAKRVFKISNNDPSENYIELRYHYAPDFITRGTRRYYKKIDSSDIPPPIKEETCDDRPVDPARQGTNSDGESNGPTRDEMKHEFYRLLADEKACRDACKEADNINSLKILKDRLDEEAGKLRQPKKDQPKLPKLTIPVDDVFTFKRIRGPLLKEEDNDHVVDYLTPFLIKINGKGKKSQLDKPNAKRVRDACMESLMKRLLDRSAIVHERLQKNQEEQRNMKNKMSRHQAGAEDEKERSDHAQNEAKQKKLSIQKQILEQRLQEHEKKAIELYQAMDARLDAEPRLKVLKDSR